ncbi:MAG: anti-sigma factor family protein [Gemmatimonadales bacterium]
MSESTPLRCEEALLVLADYLDGELHQSSHETLERHLEVCRSCFSRAEFERRLRSRLGSLAQEPLTPAFTERIRTIMDRFTI